jgi:SAM-dependent methyltransferase
MNIPCNSQIYVDCRERQVAYWDAVAAEINPRGRRYADNRRRLIEIYRLVVPPGKKILEIGSGPGDLLAAVEPSVGVGVDCSSKMIAYAEKAHPTLRFIHSDIADLELNEDFDFIILSEVANHLWDPLDAFKVIRRLMSPQTRLVLDIESRPWGWIQALIRRSGLTSGPDNNHLSLKDLTNLLDLADIEVVRHRREVLLPLSIPIVSGMLNRYLIRFWPFCVLASTNVLVARPAQALQGMGHGGPPLVSVIVPARNEAGTVPAVFDRTPEMGAGTELVFVEGGSRDDTYAAIERAMADRPGRRCKLLKQEGKGKGDAVRLGFAHASGDVLMILDSDLAVPPEDLPKFLDALTSGKAEFVNGSRLILPMEREAMRPLNLLANRFFGLAFSWVLGQPVGDTLCGTKVLWRADYEEIAANRGYFGDFDPFGDFDLLLGAARLNLKIVDVPVRYRSRVYGTTNIDRWRHGFLLIRMTAFAAKKMLFI